jgi:hypothetical protein
MKLKPIRRTHRHPYRWRAMAATLEGVTARGLRAQKEINAILEGAGGTPPEITCHHMRGGCAPFLTIHTRKGPLFLKLTKGGIRTCLKKPSNTSSV